MTFACTGRAPGRLVLCLLLAICTTFGGQVRAQANQYYGAPYFDDYIYHSDGLSNSVDEALNKWWAQYQLDWASAFPGCSYTATYDASGTTTNHFASFNLQGTCGGGGNIYGTAIAYNPDKNTGPQECSNPGHKPILCGNPINVSIGNKYQKELDFSLTPLLTFDRHYNSIATGHGTSLGPQWSHTYARNVAYTGAGTSTPIAIISRPEGNRVTFKLTAAVWKADADVIATLFRRDDAHGGLLGWTYTPQDGREVEQYDALGRLLQITKADGSFVNLTYNNGVIENNANDLRLTQVQAQDGRSLVFTYDTSNRIHQITDPSGGVYVYGYDTSGRLSTVTYPGGAQRTYLYNEPAYTGGATLPNALTGIVHEDGVRFATFNYQSDGRAISTEHAGAVDKFAVQYNADGTSTVSTPLGTTQQRTFSTVLGVKKATGIVETCADCTP
jgi:YD repeat-containing protein